jgi:hypothetical protein
MQSEMDSIWKNNTYTLSNLPPKSQAISYKWVFNIKKRREGEPDIQKARLVAKGFQQVKGVDYQETFAPVIKWATIRTMVAPAARCWQIHHMDVKMNRFL